MLIGAHVSVASGYQHTLDYAQSVNCECIQIFAKSPRQWAAAPLDPERAARFVSDREERGFGPVFTHTAYLINLSTSDSELREKSIVALADELVRGSLLAATGVVTHIGNDPDADSAAAARRAGEAIRRAFDLAGGDACRTRLLLENTAGAGRTFGGDFEQLAATLDASGMPAEHVGLCIDTCHAFAFGYALDTAAGWRELMTGIDGCCGLERLGLIHANDCKFERGSHKDRHAWIGEGFIGTDGFEAMMCTPELASVCACVEMAGDIPEKDITNIDRLRTMREACAPSQ